MCSSFLFYIYFLSFTIFFFFFYVIACCFRSIDLFLLKKLIERRYNEEVSWKCSAWLYVEQVFIGNIVKRWWMMNMCI